MNRSISVSTENRLFCYDDKKITRMTEKDLKHNTQDATERLAQAMERQNSIGWRLLLGIVAGFGTAIGATIVASIVLYILIQLFQSIGWKDTVDEWKAEMRATISEEVQTSQQELIEDATSRFTR